MSTWKKHKLKIAKSLCILRRLFPVTKMNMKKEPFRHIDKNEAFNICNEYLNSLYLSEIYPF